ncbi:hypothetical protein [Pontiella sulfatireligans]|uniref:Lipoprotein n=1 Tax=Pontiella sulfatireligans TaxID=2750658 RepID=A0A6C2UQT4_9BACT|nr:hypothetical protein [Pontiella sulfatireligans]VGO21631.1 hypothetical protein SCARR_03705 [Pontiella sulfatireligans]
MMKQTGSAALLSLLLGCALGITGCRSSNLPASASFASVEISDCSWQEIRDTTIAVFQENGFTRAPGKATQIVFTKEGSRKDTMAYGGLIAAQEGAATLVRVETELVKLQSGSRRLQCHTFVVTDAGKYNEEKHRLMNMQSKPYQKMLDDIEQRLTRVEL